MEVSKKVDEVENSVFIAVECAVDFTGGFIFSVVEFAISFNPSVVIIEEFLALMVVMVANVWSEISSIKKQGASSILSY